MSRNRMIVAVAAIVVLLVGLMGVAYYMTNRATPKAKVTKKVTLKQRVTVLEKKVVVLDERMTAVEKRVTKLENPPTPAPPPAPPAPVIAPTPPTPPAAPITKPSTNDGWRNVTTKKGWIRLGPPSTVPPPKVPVKGIEGPDIR
ncbi:MAG: hypothetical protein UV48_C0015G0026 [Candidatus Azambacteria bacterium GW2011_GWA2_42_9]|uniref:Uncharacterized protein n=3 Tax=Candidatus Azamiibacteriota TaxID=1752741 RepID=A0A0G0ZA70_9BACT|nr:MAG: hypothetical protein UV07_C0017G0011 [Candidatus Azambacteria bacterium GW2011_GWB1_42_17]KKS45554.1 MAG: hypothetical protein UV10_C0020G0011 [Candidatus Azambacteria bacterium GW2011_GWA1_42_19]KKS75268.1 MAG: hypothetical protein UV48_C0015G0026 [Candidatus Azambacteria bacterium GW2011_GWA2_42_9]